MLMMASAVPNKSQPQPKGSDASTMNRCPLMSRNPRKCAKWYASAMGNSENVNRRSRSPMSGSLCPDSHAIAAQVTANSSPNATGSPRTPIRLAIYPP